MNNSVQVASHPRLKKSLQSRLFSFAVVFLFLYVLAQTMAPFVKNKTWAGGINLLPWAAFTVWGVCFFCVQHFATKWLTKFDPYILPIVFLLIGWGNLTIWRLSASLGFRQSIWILVGSVALLVIIRFPILMEKLARYRYVWLFLCLMMVGFTLLPGFLTSSGNPSLWITIGSMHLQPSEPLKLFLIVYLASYFADRPNVNPRSWPVIIPSLFIVMITTLMLLMQKDMGTASLILMLYAFMLYAITKKKTALVVAAIILITAGFAGYQAIDVIRIRVDAWLNPWLDPTNRSYQIVQSLISLAAGGFLGTGPGLGNPELVPVAVSDFIFTSIVEETGLLGGVGLITLVFILFSRIIHASQRAETPFLGLLSGGIGMLLALQSILIIGGNIRLIPLTGVTLPFVSYGGSSLLISMVCIGLVLVISGQTPKSILAIPIVDSLRSKVLFLVILVIAAILLILPVWTVIQKDQLTQRRDNLRLALNDQLVQRGTIKDRNDAPINETVGTPGEYRRDYIYADISNIAGYANIVYGLSGIESSYDSYLRGNTGYPAFQLWSNNLLRNLNPPGLDIRLSIDLDIQKNMDTALISSRGSAVIMNASTGELLAMSSQPGFDPNQLENQWDDLIFDPDTPLLNRAVNGRYPVGTITSLFLYAQSIENNISLSDSSTRSVLFDDKKTTCAMDIVDDDSLISEKIKVTCPQIGLSIARELGKLRLYQAYSRYGWYQIPNLPLPENQIDDPGGITNIKTAAVGQENLAISPVQMAITAASISASGTRPSAKLVMAYRDPEDKWKLLETNQTTRQVFSKKTVLEMQELTLMDDLPAWGVVGKGLMGTDKWVTWFVGGTTQDWKGAPLSVAIALEEDNAAKALDLGRIILTAIIVH